MRQIERSALFWRSIDRALPFRARRLPSHSEVQTMADEQPNKRRADRLHHEILVAYRADGRDFTSSCALNFSRVGLFVNTAEVLPVGTELRLIVSLPGLGDPFEVAGRVTRALDKAVSQVSGAAPGMGIEFLDVDEATAARIEQIVQALIPTLPALNETLGTKTNA